MSGENEKSQQHDEPKPRRKKWKVVLVAFGILLLLIFTAWLTANFVVDRQIAAEFEKYRAAGQPVDIKDFWSPEIPDDQNAAILIRQAADAVTLTDKEKEILDQRANYAFVFNCPQQTETMLTKNAAALKLLDESKSRHKFSLNLRPETVDLYKFPFSNYIYLGAVKGLQAIDFVVKGDNVAAVDCVEDIERLSFYAADNYDRFGLAGLLLNGTWSVNAMENILPRCVKPSSQADLDKFNVVLNRLKQEYLDESRFVKSWMDVFYFERLRVKEMIGDVLNTDKYRASERRDIVDKYLQKYGKTICSPWIKKMMLDRIRMVDLQRSAIMAANYGAAERIIISPPLPKDFLSEKAQEISSLWAVMDLSRSYKVLLRFSFLCRAERRMAAIAIAMKQYEWDHGSPPAKLSKLVPKYLPAVPLDPFSATGEPIKLGTWGGRRLLYSVGEDGSDAAGQYAFYSEKPLLISIFYINVYDLPFFLDGNRPGPSSSSPATTYSPAVP